MAHQEGLDARDAVSGRDGDDAPDEVLHPLDGVLDLHTFHPREAREAVVAYLEACREAGVLAVRIVHGKGTGTLRAIVRSTLARIPWVRGVAEGGSGGGGWGATLVDLEPLPPGAAAQATAGDAGPDGSARKE